MMTCDRASKRASASSFGDIAGCVPTAFVLRGSDLRVRWLRCAPAECREPFFFQTANRVAERALDGTVIETSVDALPDDSEECPRPAGFIYHTSICGSTLLANMLAALPEHVVFSEPDALTRLLDAFEDRVGPDLDPYIPVLRRTMHAMGAWAAEGGARRCFIKFFSQSVHEIARIRQAMPGVPEIFLYRDPLEVVIGNLRSPTQSWPWFEKYTGVPAALAFERPLIELIARGVGRTMEVMREHVTASTLLMNYEEIGPRTPRMLLERFQVPITERAVFAMADTLKHHSKDSLRSRLFERDVETKRAEATPMLRAVVSEFAARPYQALENLRRACSAECGPEVKEDGCERR